MVKIGLLELSDSERHVVIVATLVREPRNEIVGNTIAETSESRWLFALNNGNANFFTMPDLAPHIILFGPLAQLHPTEVRFLPERQLVGLWVLIDASLGAALVLLWYSWFVRYNRRRAASVLQWVHSACLGKGRLSDLEWHSSSSRLRATLHLSSRWFDEAHLTIRLLPRPLPVQWALSRWHEQQETLTFEADMGFPPGFHLDIVRHRWSGQTSAKKSTRNWAITRPGPIILTTKEDWPAELTPVVNALATWRDKDFVSVRFDQTSPHFTATVALENLSDQKAAASVLGLFRELAASSSAKQH